jgi:hypothetical protein
MYNISGYCPTFRWALVLSISCKYLLKTALKYLEKTGSDTEESGVNVVHEMLTGILIPAAGWLFDYINLEVFE